MKLNNLKLKLSVLTGVLSTSFIINSCDEVDYSGKSATEQETTSTTTGNITATKSDYPGSDSISPGPVTGAETISSYSSSTARKGRKTGTIAVAAMAPVPASEISTVPSKIDYTGYYYKPDITASFSGGQSAMRTYIMNNLHYPEEAIDNDIEGTVSVQIGIDENGKVATVKAINNKIGYGLEEEAVRVVSEMPKWNAGTVSGKKVKTMIMLPITYKLEE